MLQPILILACATDANLDPNKNKVLVVGRGKFLRYLDLNLNAVSDWRTSAGSAFHRRTAEGKKDWEYV